MFWGLTPALDLIQQYETDTGTLPEELNVLLIGGADCRHVLKTIARRYRYDAKNVKLNFYLMEACMESVAKQLLLLYVALQKAEELGMEQKTKTFMELYGNTLVRPAVAKFLGATAENLVKMVTDYGYLKEIMPAVCLEGLKYKDRDYLENVLKFWCGNDDFDICTCWDRRLRKQLGVRYDSKAGAFDWDLHMRLHTVGGAQVCNQEYRNFRMNGIAFSWLESEVSKPNRSMVSVVVPNGDHFAHYGYLGDMQTGPFVAYGLECEDKKIQQSMHGQNHHRATDVTERNLSQIFHEIQYNCEYEHRPTSNLQLGLAVLQTPEKRVVDFHPVVRSNKRKQSKCIELEGVKIKFLSISTLERMKFRPDYKFDLVYFGSCFLKYCTEEVLNNVLSPTNGLVVVENQMFVLNHRDKQLKEHGDEIERTMKGVVDAKRLSFDVLKDNFARFVRREQMKRCDE